ncbi:MAG: hypothetical protein WC895_04295 [Candidatus Shapirobacteria bacterium]
MSKNQFSQDKFRRPEQFLSELLKKSAQGVFRESDEYTPFLFRALVVAVDVNGGKLENPSGSGTLTHVLKGKSFDVKSNVGPNNPKNSIKARIITDGFDQFVNDDRMRVFWPFFPEHMSLPIKPGEYVYIVFEDQNYEHGLWISKIPGHENVNYYKGSDSFLPNGGDSLTSKFSDTASSDDGSDDKLNKDEDAAETKPEDNLSKLF